MADLVAEWCATFVSEKGQMDLIKSDFILARSDIYESYRRILECNDFLYKNMYECEGKVLDVTKEVLELEYKALGKMLFEAIAKSNEVINRRWLNEEI